MHTADYKRSSLDGILDPFNSASVVTLDKKVAGLVNYCIAPPLDLLFRSLEY